MSEKTACGFGRFKQTHAIDLDKTLFGLGLTKTRFLSMIARHVIKYNTLEEFEKRIHPHIIRVRAYEEGIDPLNMKAVEKQKHFNSSNDN